MQAFAASLKGPRHERNMDSLRADDAAGIFAVADGIGTKRPSDRASRLALEAAFESLAGRAPAAGGWPGFDAAPPERRALLGKAVAAANGAVFAASKTPGLAGICTTLTLLALRGDDYAVAHAGDSRCYILDAGGLRQVTDDHNVAFEAFKAGAIPKEGLRTHPDRHLLTRCLGASDFVVPDIVFGRAPGARFLLCTDGVSKSLDDADIARILGCAGSGPGAVPAGPGARLAGGRAACDALAAAAAAAGSDDDVTVLLVEP